MSNGQPETLAKGKFAEHVGLTAGRISQLIASGQISSAAIIGEGRSAKINVSQAMDDLSKNLDISQRMANGAGTKTAHTPEPVDGQENHSAVQTADDDLPSRTPTTAELYQQEKLETARANNRRLKEQELHRRGMYALASEVELALTQTSNAMMRTFEGALVEMANDLAEKFSLPNRDVAHSLRASFTAFRKTAAGKESKNVEALDETFEDKTGIEGLVEDRQGEA